MAGLPQLGTVALVVPVQAVLAAGVAAVGEVVVLAVVGMALAVAWMVQMADQIAAATGLQWPWGSSARCLV